MNENINNFEEMSNILKHVTSMYEKELYSNIIHLVSNVNCDKMFVLVYIRFFLGGPDIISE